MFKKIEISSLKQQHTDIECAWHMLYHWHCASETTVWWPLATTSHVHILNFFIWTVKKKRWTEQNTQTILYWKILFELFGEKKKRNIFKLAIMHSQHRNYSEINFMVCTESWKKSYYHNAHLYLATSAGWLGWPKWFQSTCSKWKRRHLEA